MTSWEYEFFESATLTWAGIHADSSVIHVMKSCEGWKDVRSVERKKADRWQGNNLNARNHGFICGVQVADSVCLVANNRLIVSNSHGHSKYLLLFVAYILRPTGTTIEVARSTISHLGSKDTLGLDLPWSTEQRKLETSGSFSTWTKGICYVCLILVFKVPFLLPAILSIFGSTIQFR